MQRKTIEGGDFGEDETINEVGEVIALEIDEEKEKDSIECHALGLFGTNDVLTEGKTMRMEGRLNRVPISVLIESGASHNFINSQVTPALGT